MHAQAAFAQRPVVAVQLQQAGTLCGAEGQRVQRLGLGLRVVGTARMQRCQRTCQQRQAGPRLARRGLQPAEQAADQRVVLDAGRQRHRQQFHRRQPQQRGHAQQRRILGRRQRQRLRHLLRPRRTAAAQPGLAQEARLGGVFVGRGLQQRTERSKAQLAAAERGAVDGSVGGVHE